MKKFELERLTEYDDKSLLEEIRRVATLVPEGKLTHSVFNDLSRVHSRTLNSHFGSWRGALIAAGIGDRFDDITVTRSRDEIISHLQRIAKQLGRNNVTKRELQDAGGASDKPIRRLFGTYRAALEAAGLSQSPGGMRYTDEECFENLLAVWTSLGRQPYYSDMRSAPSRVGPKAYVSRWKSWRGALRAFVERVNRDEHPALKSISDRIPGPAAPEPAKKRTPRDVPLGLRYKVLIRDGNQCKLCGRRPPVVVVHVDHINPWSRGGETVIENLQVYCSDCNLGKGAFSEEIDTNR